MSDEQVGEPELLLQVLEQVQHLRLHRHVERRDRLVANDQLGLQRKRARDADTLALAARELVGIPVDVLGVEADDVEQLLGALAALPRRANAMDQQRLGDDLTDGHAGVQRRVGVLEDDLDFSAEGLEVGALE